MPSDTPLRHVIVERDGPVCIISIDRPDKRNAVDRHVADELLEAFTRFAQDDRLRVAVLCGRGGTFCAGADLGAMDDPARRNTLDPNGAGPGPMGPTRLQLDKPVIAAISGHAVAGGLELALWCDLRVADASAVFGVFCRRWGIPLIDGGTVRLPRLIGMGRAMDLILTGRAVGAQEALDIGLVNRVVPEGMARQAAEALAHQLAGFPQACLRADRRSAQAQWELDLPTALKREAAAAYEVVFSEGIPGARAFAGGAGRHGTPHRQP